VHGFEDPHDDQEPPEEKDRQQGCRHVIDDGDGAADDEQDSQGQEPAPVFLEIFQTITVKPAKLSPEIR